MPLSIVPTINVAGYKNITALIIGTISYKNVTGVSFSCISITHLKK